MAPAREESFLGKVGHILGTTEAFGTKHTMGVLLGMMNPEALRALKSRGGPIYASDYMRAMMPTAPPALRGLLGFTAAVMLDPLSYVGLGPVTKGIKGAARGGSAH
jgi:hypothetical protein